MTPNKLRDYNDYSKFKPKEINNLIRKLTISLTFLCLVQLLFWGIIHFLFPYPLKVKYGTVLLSNKNEVIGGTLNQEDKWCLYTSIDEVDPFFQQAIIQKEDRWFYYHFGINPIAIGRAFFYNLTSQKRVSGASTITMQVVRLLEPKERTYFNKLKEAFRAYQLECTYSKDEILEIYINSIPYGGNIEGIKAASVLYLQKNPDALSTAESCLLSIIPNRPTSLNIKHHNTVLKKERDKWIQRYFDEGIITEEEKISAISEPINLKRVNMPRVTPHLNRLLINKYPLEKVIHTNIDIAIQLKSSDLVNKYSKRQASIGIHNAAAIIINNKNNEVIAYIGSQDFDDNQNAGQIDGIQALRSPGSTLKPLIYALGFENGFLTPQLKILDVPKDFGTYSPLNYDEQFNGEITTTDALKQSLNIPAVAILEQLGTPLLIDQLEKMDFKSIGQQKKRLGLSLALGGCGVSLDELTRLYTTLAHEGKYIPNQYIKEGIDTLGTTVLSNESTYMIYEILRQLKRPDFPNNYQNSYHAPPIAWKTGTSYGRRDAWSVGYNEDYTVGVWCGNFNNIGVAGLTGAETATPLLFSLFQSLYQGNNINKWEFNVPDNLFERSVCATSGKVPNYFCDHTIEDWYIPLVSHSEKCTHLKTYFVNLEATMYYCHDCLPKQGGYIKKQYGNPPVELVSFNLDNNIPFNSPPEHNPKCKTLLSGKAPKIVSPIDGRKYYILDHTTQLELKAHIGPDVSYIYWYVNDQFVQKIERGQTLFHNFSYGQNKISCTDDKGRNTEIYIFVE
ncbi:penicillin-binding protein 1C [Flammeovirga pacifica]|uniref:peptidoglycan glycosyltransferase n=1 Tax=Flammeovirga pacifica TaxID=915059 RepID=A0A1S1YZW9_FLAPC|nr:penicillin-binding protein 1C [Flammeovirga pacifica]OHX66558.1 penicillin-binding protein 1C [Flammeovirga pacifica]